jgi:hypothetical protein
MGERALWLILALPLAVTAGRADGQPSWRFVDATAEAGLVSVHGYTAPFQADGAKTAASGAAAGDFDGDGNVDLYVVTGDAGSNHLFRNQGDGTFVDRATAAGVARTGTSSNGPLFFDYDGDGRLDLFVGGVGTTPAVLYHNLGDGRFADVTEATGLGGLGLTASATAADYDRDGWLDLFIGRWGNVAGACHLWRNLSGQRFACADGDSGLNLGIADTLLDSTYTGNFVDLDQDGAPDLLVAADFGQSTVWHNRGDGHFVNITNHALTEENGMGAAIGDYDGDGRLDWFVTSIMGTVPGRHEGSKTGNRLYRGVGDGTTFEEVSAEAGVRDGGWGWGTSFVDLNNDGWLDLPQAQGWWQAETTFFFTPARLFRGSAEGHFEESAAALGFDDNTNGRGIVCFDYDHDGDLDIFIAHNGAPHKLWRNEGGNAGHYLDVSVAGTAPNVFAVGATIWLTAGGRSQMRLVRDGSNYVSQDPFEAHFGLGDVTSVDQVKVRWPDGQELSVGPVGVDRRLEVRPGAPATSPEPRPGCSH